MLVGFKNTMIGCCIQYILGSSSKMHITSHHIYYLTTKLAALSPIYWPVQVINVIVWATSILPEQMLGCRPTRTSWHHYVDTLVHKIWCAVLSMEYATLRMNMKQCKKCWRWSQRIWCWNITTDESDDQRSTVTRIPDVAKRHQQDKPFLLHDEDVLCLRHQILSLSPYQHQQS